MRKLFLLVVCIGSNLLATSVITHDYQPPSTTSFSPWLTGPLLAPGVETNPVGHVSFEPLAYFTTYTGFYGDQWKAHSLPNFYSSLLAVYASIGISSFSDVAFFPQLYYQFTEDQSSYQFGDIPFAIRFQLFKTREDTWIPDIRLSIGATAPTGKYNNLNPKKLGTDSVGYGSWFPEATLSIGKIFPISSKRIFYPSFAISYVLSNNVPVKNLSIYG